MRADIRNVGFNRVGTPRRPSTSRASPEQEELMNPFLRPSTPSSAATELASLLQWVRAARVVVLASGVIAVLAGLMLVSKDRRIEGLALGVAGVAAAVVAQVVIGYVAWRAHASVQQDAPGPATETTETAETTGANADGRADLG
ncbi:MAG: hypothetical protein ABW219_07435 [Ilumatobacteraceae bacterium]